jgi:hypothetical protein
MTELRFAVFVTFSCLRGHFPGADDTLLRLRNGGGVATSDICILSSAGDIMRAEIVTIVGEIKQSLGLLRRHL